MNFKQGLIAVMNCPHFVSKLVFFIPSSQKKYSGRNSRRLGERAASALTTTEVRLLDELVKSKSRVSGKKATVSDYIIKIARLGGYLARAADPPPGNLVMWRGLSRLNDIQLGFLIGTKTCG